jgi:hypothetical protein
MRWAAKKQKADMANIANKKSEIAGPEQGIAKGIGS